MSMSRGDALRCPILEPILPAMPAGFGWKQGGTEEYVSKLSKDHYQRHHLSALIDTSSRTHTHTE